MKTFKISNAPITFFESKEHYVSFRKAWKDNFAQGKHKPYSHGSSYDGTPLRAVSDITSSHHMIYNALRGRDLGKSYTPITNSNKLNHSGISAYGGCIQAHRKIFYAQALVKEMAGEKKRIWLIDRLDADVKLLLAPFNGTITHDTLIKLCEHLTHPDEWEEVK